MAALESTLRALARRRLRFPTDETLPSGETVNEAVGRAMPLVRPTRQGINPSGVILERPLEDEAPQVPVRKLTPATTGMLVNPSPPATDYPPGNDLRTSYTPTPETVLPTPMVAPTRNLPPVEAGTTVLNEPAPIMVEAGNRPVRRSTGDTLADAVDYLDQLQRYRPKDNNGRLKSFGLGLLRGFGQGGLGGAIFGGLRGAIDKSSDEQDARVENMARVQPEIAGAIGRRKAQVDLESDQVMNDYRRAQIPYLEARPGLEAEKLQAKREYDAWRMKSGDRKADTFENFTKWRMENGDRRAASYEDYLEFQKVSTDRRLTEAERHNQANETLGVFNTGIRQEGNQIRRESNDIRREGQTTSGNPARDRSNAQRLLNQARTFRTRAAAAKTQEAADELNATAEEFEQDAVNQYPEYVEQETQGTGMMGGRIGSAPTRLRMKGGTPAVTPTRALPKLSEQQIRDAAKAKNLDPDKAVAKARARGQL